MQGRLRAAEIAWRCAARSGQVSRQVPALAGVPATRFAMAVATVDGGLAHIGDAALAVMQGRGTVCVWSPPLDADGNSAGGVAAIEEFARLAGWSVF